MSGTHTATPSGLKPKYAAICPFFAPHRSYGYALSQENDQLAHEFHPQDTKGVAA